MNRTLLTTLYVLLLVGLTALGVSCASEAQIAASRDVAAAIVAATDPASPGGMQVTAEEEESIATLMQGLREAEGIDWNGVGAGAVGALAAMFPLLRIIPNRWILGGAPDADVKRAAGLPA